MKKLKINIIWALILLPAFSFADKGKYIYKIDLTRVIDDKVYVEMTPPNIKESEIIFFIPKMIPGTYAIEDYGRFISKFKAMDKKGRLLPVVQLDTNSWKISRANKLRKINYWVEDSYDTKLEGPDIFQPAGTNIEEGKNYILNSGGYFGYFQGFKNINFTLNVVHDPQFYGSTGLLPVSINNPVSTSFDMKGVNISANSKVDIFSTSSYDALVDSPIMYCQPDTTVINVAGTHVLVSVYAPEHKVNSKQIAGSITEVLNAQKNYLGGQLPVKKYAFIFYFTEEPVTSYGALEHSYSSFYYMPEMSIDQMEGQLRDFAAHEFFHIVTPLSIHSKEIGDFDFNNPKMSEHLWLYEGMTEYFAGNAQVKGKLISPDEYFNVLRQKMIVSSQYNDTLAFTKLSKGVLDKYADQYYNVYQKGALISMCLDILLLDHSDGTYGVQQMMHDLSLKFGKDRAFKDDELFDVIASLTYPGIRDFFKKYVEGNEPLPYSEILNKVGIKFARIDTVMDYSLGIEQQNIGIDMEKGQLYIQNDDQLNDFGKALGFMNGDVILKIQGKDFPPLGPTTQQYINDLMNSMKEGQPFTVTINRLKQDSTYQETTLNTKIIRVKRPVPYAMHPIENPTDHQLLVRKAWLGL